MLIFKYHPQQETPFNTFNINNAKIMKLHDMLP